MNNARKCAKRYAPCHFEHPFDDVDAVEEEEEGLSYYYT